MEHTGGAGRVGWHNRSAGCRYLKKNHYRLVSSIILRKGAQPPPVMGHQRKSECPPCVLSPLVELQGLILRVVDDEERSGAVVVLGESDCGRVVRQVHVDDDATHLHDGRKSDSVLVFIRA